MVSKCDTCIHSYPDCPSKGDDVKFAVQTDVIISCVKWVDVEAKDGETNKED